MDEVWRSSGRPYAVYTSTSTVIGPSNSVSPWIRGRGLEKVMVTP